jgi:predicted DNA-binding protein
VPTRCVCSLGLLFLLYRFVKLPVQDEFNTQVDVRAIIYPNMKTIAITIEDNMLKRIDAIAAADSKSTANRSLFIREAIRAHLAALEKAREELREREIFRRNRSRLHKQALALVKEQAKP